MNKRTNTSIQMIADYDGDVTNLFNVNIEGELPILATRNMAMFPGVITPVLIGRRQPDTQASRRRFRHILPTQPRD